MHNIRSLSFKMYQPWSGGCQVKNKQGLLPNLRLQEIKMAQLMLRANNKIIAAQTLPFSPTKGSDQVNTSMKLGSQ